MDYRHSSPARRTDSLRPSTQRQRSNSFPIVEALGCSTPEAQLILAEGRAAVGRRRGRRNRSFDDDEETPTAFNPKDHMKYLMAEQPALSEARSCHARIPSNATDRSTSTIVAVPRDSKHGSMASSTGPLGNYSAHLAQFIKAQLKSIPTYQSEQEFVTNLSPQSCPEFSFPTQSPPLSPRKSMRRAMEVPQSIQIPPVRPPMRSAFSAWSSTDDDEEEDEEVQSLPEIDEYTMDAISKISTCTSSVLGYYEGDNNDSLFSSSPLEGNDGPDTARGQNFAVQPAPTSSASESYDENDYPSSSFSRPLLSSSSAPSYPSSSASASSYFNCKRPFADGPITTDRIIAALTPPRAYGKTISAVSPWEGGAISNVHDVFIDSQQRVHVDGMSFDMMGNFIAPGSVTTPC